MSYPFVDLTCPMPGCVDILAITYEGAFQINATDLAQAEQVSVEDMNTQHWTVSCAAGHVVLLPGDTGCDCTDHTDEQCCPVEDQFDWGDPYDNVRTFRPHDWARLRTVLDALGGQS